jgi:hypothetical protein
MRRLADLIAERTAAMPEKANLPYRRQSAVICG